MQGHIRYVRTALQEKVKDPVFLGKYEDSGLSRADNPELLVADFWEQIGTFVKYELIDERSWLDIASSQILHAWEDLERPITVMRLRGGPSVYENFEYIAVRSSLWVRRHPKGTYPAGTPRMASLEGEDKVSPRT